MVPINVIKIIHCQLNTTESLNQDAAIEPKFERAFESQLESRPFLSLGIPSNFIDQEILFVWRLVMNDSATTSRNFDRTEFRPDPKNSGQTFRRNFAVRIFLVKFSTAFQSNIFSEDENVEVKFLPGILPSRVRILLSNKLDKNMLWGRFGCAMVRKLQ